MARRAYQSQYFADDKDIFDLIGSAKQSMSSKRLVELARQRGIFLSEDEDRADLVDYVSQLSFDWVGLSELLAAIDSPDRAEKQSSSLIESSANVEDLLKAVAAVQAERQEENEEEYVLEPSPSGLKVRVNYTDLDTSRTRINQRRHKQLTVVFEKTESGSWRARHEANGRSEDILEDIVGALSLEGQPPVARRSIELTGIVDPAARTDFFLRLMGGMKAFDMVEVRTINVDRIRPDEDDEDDGEESGDLEDGEKPPPKNEEVAMLAMVRSVLLKGVDLLKSDEYQELTKKGFFISHAVWQAQEKKTGGNRFDFEAEFVDGPRARKFRYGPRAMYQRKKNGEFKRTSDQVQESDKVALSQAIEFAAQFALEHVTANAVALGAAPTVSVPPSKVSS